MQTKKVVIRPIFQGLEGRALVSYCVQKFEAMSGNIPHATILHHTPLDTDPVYHLQRLNGDYFVITPSQGVLMTTQDEAVARSYLHETATIKANSLASRLVGFEVLDLTNFSLKASPSC